MAKPYQDDLRGKLLEAYEGEVGSVRKLAAQFRVSWGYTRKIRAQRLRSGQKGRPVQLGHGLLVPSPYVPFLLFLPCSSALPFFSPASCVKGIGARSGPMRTTRVSIIS